MNLVDLKLAGIFLSVFFFGMFIYRLLSLHYKGHYKDQGENIYRYFKEHEQSVVK